MSDFYENRTERMPGELSRVTADLPTPDAAPSHWWTTFRGIHWQPEHRAAAAERKLILPCREEENSFVLRIPFVKGGTKILADIVDNWLLSADWLQNMREPITGRKLCTAHITTEPPFPDCEDQDDPFLLKFWNMYSRATSPHVAHWLWEEEKPSAEASTAGNVPLRGWTEEIADEELKNLYNEIKTEKKRRKTGGKDAPPAWLAELDECEISEMYEDIRNDLIKRGRAGVNKETTL